MRVSRFLTILPMLRAISSFQQIITVSKNQLRQGRYNSIIQHSSVTLQVSSSSQESVQEPEQEEEEVGNDDLSSNPYFWREARKKCWRPVVSDVERISWGKPAKKKRTGSRGVPHRLNQEERFLYDQGRKKGFLEVAGSAWRSQRREAPLLNTYRSLCDARSKAFIVLHKGNSGEDDDVVVDLSPLRMPQNFDKTECFLRSHETLSPYADYFSKLVIENEDNDSQDEDEDREIIDDNEDAWDTRPIYQLPQYYLSWNKLPRSVAKNLSKELSILFDAKDPKASKSLKPKGVKAGKGRRSGGYGIG